MSQIHNKMTHTRVKF